jgi:nucleoside-diphosphate-sugar epimerase
MAAMLSSGSRIIVLGRSNKEESLKERISKLLRWFGIEQFSDQLELAEIDFMKPKLGLTETEYSHICAETETVIHCASDTSFSERKRDVVFKSNVASLEKILEFASDAKTTFFHYISTAYVAGLNDSVCSERLSSSTDFLNVYEESKARAENLIASYCEKKSIPFTIIRPSVVYGDSRTGRSLRFNALYFPIQSVKYISDIYLNDIKNNDGKKSKQHGIYLGEDGYLFMPLRIYLPKEGALNIIPVDYFVDATMKIILNSSTGGIYHLTNNSHTKLEMIAVYNEQFMKIRGVEIIYGKTDEKILRNPVEELFDRFMEPYRAYLSDNRVFERANTDKATNNLVPPEFTYDIFKRCMEYAIKVNWGQSIF